MQGLIQSGNIASTSSSNSVLSIPVVSSVDRASAVDTLRRLDVIF